MMLTVSAVAIGLAIGVLTGGRLRRLTGAEVHLVPLAIVGGLVPFVVGITDPPGAAAWIALALLAIIGFGAANLHLVGMGVVLVGVVANLTPLLLNGHMPVAPDALVAAGLAEENELGTVGLNGGRALDDDATLGVLGDIIPVAATGQVLSFGDLIILVGLADVAAHLVMRRRRHRVHAAGSRAALSAIVDISPQSPAGTVPSPIHNASPAQDWGTAPPPTPLSAFQYSASADAAAPDRVAAARASAPG